MASASVVVSMCGRTHIGRVRKENQDNLLIANLGDRDAAGGGTTPPGTSIGPLQITLTNRGVVLLVADGMGGRAGGAKASTLAIEAVRRSMTEARESAPGGPHGFVDNLRRALEMANEEIHEESRRDDGLRGMGTTATLAGIHGDSVYVAQVGDSRAYLIRKNTLARMTRDQSMVQNLIDSGVLREEDAKNMRDNRILQALGTHPTVAPELTYHDLRRDDVVLLCSDGLSRVVEDVEILDVVRGAGDCLAVCDQLIALANARGGPDNITVVVARLGGEALSPAGESTIARRVYIPTSG